MPTRRKPPERGLLADRRKNPRGGRRATDDNNEERELRVQQIVEYLRQQNPESAFEVLDIQRDKDRKA
jgi:hypothetical protein